MDPIDRLIEGLDLALRAVAGVHRARRPSPAEGREEGRLDDAERAHAAALMRVNHVGEVCAQALYQAQALTAREAGNRQALEHAAEEEQDHLAWSAARVDELGGRLSFANPLWYAGAFAIGTAAGVLGDRWSLAFLAETERQVEDHLSGHLRQLSPKDVRTRAVVEQMRMDEARHRDTALSLGALELPLPLKGVMRLMSKVMTRGAYRI